MTLPKPTLMVAVWGAALAVSVGLRRWGELRAEPLQPSWPVVWLAVLLPSLLMGCWLFVQSGSDHEGRESTDCDQEIR